MTEPIPPGRHVRGIGEDVMAGETLLPVGHRIRPVDAAVVAGAGLTSVRVVRRPRIAVLPTGDEIRPIGTTTLAPGEVLDTNSPMLEALACEAGCEPVHIPITPDEPDVLAAVARAAAGQADLLLVIAGSSRGRDDHTATVLAAIGGVAVHGVAMRPGHPVVLGVVSGDSPTPVIGVPGYPISAAHVFETFARPLIETLHGGTVAVPATVRARLTCAVSSPPRVDESLLVRLEKRPAGVGALHAVPIGRGAGALSALMRADGTIRVPAGTGGYEAGEEVLVECRSGAPSERDEPESPPHSSTIRPEYAHARNVEERRLLN